MLQANRKPTLSEQAYNQIKDALLNGRILPGDVLSENQLAADMDMSRTPVREALRALASEGWVDIRNGVGAYVKPLSSKDMEDLYEVRCRSCRPSRPPSSISRRRRSTGWRNVSAGFSPSARPGTPPTPWSSPSWTGSFTS